MRLLIRSLLPVLLFSPSTSPAQIADAIAYAHFRMRMAGNQESVFMPPLPSQDPASYPAGVEHYVLVWSSFNEGTLDRDTHIVRARELVTLQTKLAELVRHGDAPGMESPIIYFTVRYHGDRNATVRTDWMTNVPRSEDLYFERRK